MFWIVGVLAFALAAFLSALRILAAVVLTPVFAAIGARMIAPGADEFWTVFWVMTVILFPLAAVVTRSRTR